MDETVKLILSLSVSGGLFALVLFTLKPFMRNRLSKSFQYYIWLVVLLRFIMPFSFGINLMDFTFNAPNEPLATEEAVIPNNNPIDPSNANPNPAVNNAINNNTPEMTNQKPSAPVSTDNVKTFDFIRTLADNLLWIWLAGAVISAAWNILTYLHFIRYVHGAAYTVKIPGEKLPPDCGAKIYKSRFSPTPMLVGVIKPRIYLPDIKYTDVQLNNILLHELTHLRRRDVWLKWFAALVVSAHWFNPIAYFMRREFNRACELSCDEAIICGLDGTAKQGYGDTLISVVAESRYPVGVMSVTMCEEKRKLKERLVAIMNYKKKTKIAIFITAVLAVAITCSAFAFGAQNGNFSFWKPSVYSVAFPYERVSDINAEDLTALILEKISNPKADIYLYSNSHDVSLNIDYTLKDFTVRVLISEYKDGALVYRPYQIRIFPDGKNGKMNIFPYDSLLTDDTEQRLCSFVEFWNALTYLPVEAIKNAVPKEAPSFYSFEYTTLDPYKGALPKTNFIFFDKDGVIEEYKGTPSVIFIFWVQYQNEMNNNHFSGINGADLYYYADRNIKTDNIAVDYSYDISLSDLHQLAAKGDGLTIVDFKNFEGQDVGSGPYVMYYKIENGYYLLLSSPGEGKPWYIRLHIPGVEEYIDIRYEDIDEFIGKHPVPNELNAQIYEYLSTIMSSPAYSSATGDYIKAHQNEYDAIVDMGMNALPTLTGILNSGDYGLRGNITALLVGDIVTAERIKANYLWTEGIVMSAASDLSRWTERAMPNDIPATRDETANDLEIVRAIISVTVDHSLNWNNIYPRIYTSGKKINAVLDYIDDLTLKDEFPENPNEYDGSTSTITILFDDGTESVYYHFGNMFFGKKTENGIDWKRMEYEEAVKFDVLIQNNLSD